MMKQIASAGWMTLAACVFAAPARAQTGVVNVDVGLNQDTHEGQGAYPDEGNDFWNAMDSVGTGFKESDGVTNSSITVDLVSFADFGYGNGNSMLGDYRYISKFGTPSVGGITIAGLTPGATYTLYVYSAGNQLDQEGLITLNGVVGCTSGSLSDQYVEGENYVVLEVDADSAGEITGTWQAFVEFAAINGFQIVEGPRPPQVLDITGSESPTVHSPNDPIEVTVEFNEVVTLSQVGGAELVLDFDGTIVVANHVDALEGESLTFEASAPALTTMNGKVVAGSLQLVGAATLLDADANVVDVTHGEVALPYDQISTQRLSVYQPVPGGELDESPHYRFRVRGVDQSWQTPYAWFTRCIDQGTGTALDNYYKDDIGGWSHTYCNFEMANNVPVEVEITRLVDGQQVDIQKATPHPRRKVRSWRVEDGRAYVVIDRPTLFAVDIDGQMDDSPFVPGQNVNEDALHGVSVFANPILLDKPDAGTPGVLEVTPGMIPVDDGTWTTLVFQPGVHRLFEGLKWTLGDDFALKGDRTIYIPGDAVVHGNFTNLGDAANARNIRIYGHGTLSGELIDHPKTFGIDDLDGSQPFRPVYVGGDAKGCRVEGITIVDPAFHSCALNGGYNASPDDINFIRWTKSISWRANGDGLSPNGSGYVEDCFLRTQDDGTYILGLGIRRMVYWGDVNGMPLRCSQLTKFNSDYNKEPLLVEDIDVIYSRTAFVGEAGPAGRSVIGYPAPSESFPGNTGAHVVFRDVNVEDLFPSRMLFGWDLTIGTGETGGAGPRSGVHFQNVRAAARNVDAELDILFGDEDAPISNLVFEDVTLAGEHYDDIDDFMTNEFVADLVFLGTEPAASTYLGTSGYGKWYVQDDWDTALEPAANDLVQHTMVGDVLIVDAPAYAGTLTVSHPSTATVSIEAGGRLTVADTVALGGSGVGDVNLVDGTLELTSDQAGALTVANGRVHISGGEILWAGDHVLDVHNLFAANAISFPLDEPGSLYAFFDGTSTRVWVTDCAATGTCDPDAEGWTLVGSPNPLTADVDAISTGTGGAQLLFLNAGSANAGDLYLMLGSTSGTVPGLPTGFGGQVLPLNFDSYLELLLASPSPVFLQDSLGPLDPSGRALIQFQTTPGALSSYAGLTVHHAFVVLDLVPSLTLPLVSNAVALQLEP